MYTGLSLCWLFCPCFKAHMQGVYTKMGLHSDHLGKMKDLLVSICRVQEQ